MNFSLLWESFNWPLRQGFLKTKQIYLTGFFNGEHITVGSNITEGSENSLPGSLLYSGNEIKGQEQIFSEQNGTWTRDIPKPSLLRPSVS